MNAPAPATARIPIAAVGGLIDDAMRVAGVPAADAGKIAELMLEADLIGADAHGVFRLPQYVQRLKLGSTNPRPTITVERSAPATALVHGDNGMGHLVVSRAAETAVALARECGVAWVGCVMSGHAGAAGVYAALPLKADMIGLYSAVANANHMPLAGGAESGGDALLVLCHAVVELLQQPLPRLGQVERIGAAIRGCHDALGEAAPLQLVDGSHEIGLLDAERRADLGLLKARIGGDHRQDRELRRPDIDIGHPFDEVLKDEELDAAQRIADEARQGPKIDRRRGRSVRGGGAVWKAPTLARHGLEGSRRHGALRIRRIGVGPGAIALSA